MQRRAAAVYFALFVLIGAGTFAFIQVGTSQPDVRLDADTLTSGDSRTIAGTEYTISEIGEVASEGGGGGGIEGTVTWTNESFVATTSFDNGSTTSYQGDEYTVLIANESDVGEFELVEVINVTALLVDSDAVENQLATKNGTDYVVFTENNSLKPLSAWLPEPTRQGPFAEGGTYQHPVDNGTVDATVRDVTPEAATIAWDSTREEEVTLTEGGNVTLGGTQYFAHFIDADQVQLVPTNQYWDAYQEELNYEDEWFERHAGLWAVVIASFMAAVILLSAAYMPVKS